MAVSPVKLRVVREKKSRAKPYEAIGFSAELEFPFKSTTAEEFIEVAKASSPAVRLDRSKHVITCSFGSKKFERPSLTVSEDEQTRLEPMFDASGNLLADTEIVLVKVGTLYNPVVLFEHLNGASLKKRSAKTVSKK